MKDETPLVSFCLTSRNAERDIGRMLQSIMDLRWQNKEVVIVDESEDSTPEIAALFAARCGYIRLFRLEGKRGLGFARQFALERARGPLVAFMDADAWISTPLWVERMRAHLGPPGVGGVFSGRLAHNRASALARYWSATFRKRAKRLYARIGTGNVLLRRDAIEASRARFDPRLKINEDFDFFIQINAAGFRFVYEPDAAIEQIQPDTLAEILSKRIGYAKWNLIRLRFNGGAASFFARACLRCLLFPAAAALALLQALCWCTETGDPAALWHVPVETLMSFLYPFLAARYAFGPVPPEAR